MGSRCFRRQSLWMGSSFQGPHSPRGKVDGGVPFADQYLASGSHLSSPSLVLPFFRGIRSGSRQPTPCCGFLNHQGASRSSAALLKASQTLQWAAFVFRLCHPFTSQVWTFWVVVLLSPKNRSFGGMVSSLVDLPSHLLEVEDPGRGLFTSCLYLELWV